MKTVVNEMEERDSKRQCKDWNDQVYQNLADCAEFSNSEQQQQQQQQQQHKPQNYCNDDNVSRVHETYSYANSCSYNMSEDAEVDKSIYANTYDNTVATTGYEVQTQSLPIATTTTTTTTTTTIDLRSKMLTCNEQPLEQLHKQQQRHRYQQPLLQRYMYGPISEQQQQQQQFVQEYYPMQLPPNRWYSKGSTDSHPAQSYIPHYPLQQSSISTERHMMNMFHLSSSGREARNRAEKNRRDRLNSSIQELSTLIPHVADSPRRVDKIAVLRFATHGLRLKHVFGKSLCNANSQTMDTLMKLLDSFFLTLTCNGQIVLISASVEQHLGHCQADLYGQNILSITHPEDHVMLKQKLMPTDLDSLFQVQPERVNDSISATCLHANQLAEEEIDRKLRSDKRTFTVRLAKAGPRSEPPTYELVRIDGTFRRSDLAPRSLTNNSIPSHLQLMRRCHTRDDILPLHTISGNDIELVAIVRTVKCPTIQRSLDNNLSEYKTRHLIDGCIVNCDQRISLVAGYMQDEVCNLSPFTFMHQDDVRWVIVALRQMYDCNSSYGESAYRLFTRNGDMIYLYTRGYLEIDKSTNQVHSFICINTQLDEKEGKRRIQEMKKKFSIIINAKIPQSSIDAPASENPQQLERAVLCLIQNLKSNSSEIDNNPTPPNSLPTISPNISLAYRTSSIYNHNTVPLSLVVPTVDTVKSSIVKSVGVLKVTGGRKKHSKDIYTNNSQSDSDYQLSDAIYPQCGNNNDSNSCNENTMKQYENNDNNNINLRQGGHRDFINLSGEAVKRKLSFTCNENQEFVPIQRKAIENALTTSLKHLDNKLNEQLRTATEIRDQQEKYDIPYTEHHIDDIMKEHKKQREMYNDIAAEFQNQNRNNNETSSTFSNDYEL